jgi:hypothetical protein
MNGCGDLMWIQQTIHRYNTMRFAFRLGITSVLILVSFLLMFPWSGGYCPEGNLLPGPLWLLKNGHDRIPGIAMCVFCVVVFFLPLGLRFSWGRVILFLAGMLLWIGMGMVLAMNAVA